MSWELPTPTVGEIAHYLYDISGRHHIGLTEGSKLFLFGKNKAPVSGLFALATCEVRDDESQNREKEHDAFVKVRFDSVLEPPIPVNVVRSGGTECESAISKLMNDNNLQMRRISLEESDALRSLFRNEQSGS